MEIKHWYEVTENHEYDPEASAVVCRVLATESEIENFEWEPDPESYDHDVYYTFKMVNGFRSIDSMKAAFARQVNEERLERERREAEREANERSRRESEPPIPDGFVRVFVGTAIQREAIDVEPETKIEDIIAMCACKIDFSGYASWAMTLKGVSLIEHRGDFKRTLADYGIMSGRCILTAAKVSMNV